MTVFDLTHTIMDGMPVFPGTPEVETEKKFSVPDDGFAETGIVLCSHVGTHMDAPAHIFENGVTLDKMDPAAFIGRGCVVDCRGAALITREHIAAAGKRAETADFLLFCTGWERLWGEPGYFENFPAFDKTVMEYCAKTKNGSRDRRYFGGSRG